MADLTTWHRYQRIGEVWAWRLTTPREWQTDAGDSLRGEAGDWWVVSPDGAFRTVAATVFPTDYEHVDAQVYRRRGIMSARRTTARETVMSLEGPSTAEAGDWILLDESGNTWAVPDPVFRHGYELID